MDGFIIEFQKNLPFSVTVTYIPMTFKSLYMLLPVSSSNTTDIRDTREREREREREDIEELDRVTVTMFCNISTGLSNK
jgi:hypothetical protein